MFVMVMYDISSNRARRRVAVACLDLGMKRVQHSVFVGSASAKQRERIYARLCAALEEEAGLIHVMPLHRDNLEGLQAIYNAGAEEDEEAAHDDAA